MKKGLTQKGFAEAFNIYIYENNLTIKPINFSVVSKWETGKSSPTKATYEALADYFNVSVPYLQGKIFKEDLDDEAQEMFEDVQDYISYVVPNELIEIVLKALLNSYEYNYESDRWK